MCYSVRLSCYDGGTSRPAAALRPPRCPRVQLCTSCSSCRAERRAVTAPPPTCCCVPPRRRYSLLLLVCLDTATLRLGWILLLRDPENYFKKDDNGDDGGEERRRRRGGMQPPAPPRRGDGKVRCDQIVRDSSIMSPCAHPINTLLLAKPRMYSTSTRSNVIESFV